MFALFFSPSSTCTENQGDFSFSGFIAHADCFSRLVNFKLEMQPFLYKTILLWVKELILYVTFPGCSHLGIKLVVKCKKVKSLSSPFRYFSGLV